MWTYWAKQYNPPVTPVVGLLQYQHLKLQKRRRREAEEGDAEKIGDVNRICERI